MEGVVPDFRRLFESAPGSFLVLTPDLTIVAVTDAYAQATMTRREEIVGRGIFSVFPDNPEDPAATGVATLRDSLLRVLSQRRPDAMAVQKYDVRRPDAEGGGFETRYWSPLNSPVLDESGEISHIIHRVDDVTEFVRLQHARREQELATEALQVRADAMETEVFRRAQQIQDANRELRTHQAELEARVAERTATLREKNEALEREIAERQKTEQALRRSEDQLRQAQKLEAVGRLAGGVAHDFNNILSAILSYAAFVLEALREDDPVREDVAEIRDAGERAAALTRQLLAFSRHQVLEVTVLDLNEIVGGVERMLRRTLGEDIQLRLVLQEDLGRVSSDRGQIEQVILNLVVNARDAMPRGGRLTIETANVDFSDVQAAERLGARAGPHVMLSVSDTGIGMDKETQARVFEPFFTTKERGKGTGLGLSTAFGIVKQSGGTLWLYSEVGEGTTFKVYLPVVEHEARATVSSMPPVLPAARGHETVLLVEDDEQVRAVAAEILRRAGYTVLETGGPLAALAACAEHAGPVEVLLTDVVMPSMNGKDLAEQVRALRPQIRVLFMSGYTDDVILHQGLEAGVRFVQKPLRPETLLRKLRDALDAAP
ncbi:MAG: response regulator [Deltaproteobacteria bacterium]|nr:response regulator [Deltaproteobacteria bacterium]